MSNFIKIVFLIITITLIAILSSCSTLSYYGQSVSGHLQLLRARKDLETVLQSAYTLPELKNQLQRVSEIRNFASEVLGLPDNNSYRSYADIGRKYIVWNVFATPALSLQPHLSCFVIVGCLSYRGYYKKVDALAYMHRLEAEGFDVYLGGVAAYSTLGWFDDPVLKGMLERNETDLARLIFHELAHQQLYIKNDTEFNEAFADAVALIGLEFWLGAHTTTEQKRDFEDQLTRENQFIELVLSYQHRLNQLYNSAVADEQKHLQKTALYKELQFAYEHLRVSWGGHSEYDKWFKHKLNNAKIAAISTYRNLVPQFLAVYEATGRNMQDFFSHIEQIGKCEPDQRRQLLHSGPQSTAC
jgi:predicted aminopeptidase